MLNHLTFKSTYPWLAFNRFGCWILNLHPKAGCPCLFIFTSVQSLSCDCSMPGLPVHHQLPELAQTHVHQVSDAIQPSHPSPPTFNLSQHQCLCKWVSSSNQEAKVLEFQLQHQLHYSSWLFKVPLLPFHTVHRVLTARILHHQLNGHEFVQTPRESGRQRGLVVLQSLGSQRFNWTTTTATKIPLVEINIESLLLSLPSSFYVSTFRFPSPVATGLEKVSFHSNPKERQCQRMFKLPHNCTHFTH